MSGLLKVSSNPHIRSKVTTSSIMTAVVIALLPAAGFGIYNFGPRALAVMAVTIASTVLTELLFGWLWKKKITISDMSAVVTGLLLALNLPVSIPLWMAALGGVFAILVVKMLFGGLGQNFMNPALAARCFLLISFPSQMTNFACDAYTGATPLAALKAGESVNVMNMIVGKTAGTIGETSVIALLIGALFGVVIHYWIPSGYIKDTVIVEGVLYVVGQGFIRLMQMLVVPLVFCSLICGSMAIGDTKTLGKVGVKTIGFYLVTTALAVCVALGSALLINPGLGLDMDAVQKGTVSSTTEATSLVDTLLNIIPKNPVQSMANGDMLPIIVFALFVGIMLAKLGTRGSVVANFFSQFNDVMMEMTMAIMKIAPIGVFCLIARTFATVGFSAFAPMLKYMGNVTLALAIQCLIVYQILLFVFTRLNPFKFIKKFLPVMGFAFSTATSNATIPMSIDTLSKKMGVSKQISSFTIPLGATINMDGTSIMQGVAVVFIAQAYGIPLTMGNLATVVVTATLASIGTAGVPSVGLVTLAMVLNSVGLPTEGIALIMGIDRILDMIRTAVNITGDAVCTTIVCHQEGSLNREVFNRD